MSFQKYPNLYVDISNILIFTIASGQSVSNYLDFRNIMNRGCTTPRRLITPEGFSPNVITFETAEDNGSGMPDTFLPYYFCDGINTVNVALSVTAAGGSCIGFPAVWLDSVAFLRLITGSPVGTNITLRMASDPLYQGAI